MITAPRWRVRLVTGIAVLVAATASAAAAVHPTGVLKLASRSLVAGTTIPVSGEKFPHSASLALVLIGVDGRLTLHTVQSDVAGTFTDSLSIPGDIEPGSYRLVAIASDGDLVGTLDIEIALGSPPTTPDDAVVHEPVQHSEPTAEPLGLERARSPLVTGSALGVVVLALVLGGIMLRRPATPAS